MNNADDKLSKRELAELFGVSVTAITNWERPEDARLRPVEVRERARPTRMTWRPSWHGGA
jgi:transcriptional regulator with XRE-family HTH domain